MEEEEAGEMKVICEAMQFQDPPLLLVVGEVVASIMLPFHSPLEYYYDYYLSFLLLFFVHCRLSFGTSCNLQSANN